MQILTGKCHPRVETAAGKWQARKKKGHVALLAIRRKKYAILYLSNTA